MNTVDAIKEQVQAQIETIETVYNFECGYLKQKASALKDLDLDTISQYIYEKQQRNEMKTNKEILKYINTLIQNGLG